MLAQGTIDRARLRSIGCSDGLELNPSIPNTPQSSTSNLNASSYIARVWQLPCDAFRVSCFRLFPLRERKAEPWYYSGARSAQLEPGVPQNVFEPAKPPDKGRPERAAAGGGRNECAQRRRAKVPGARGRRARCRRRNSELASRVAVASGPRVGGRLAVETPGPAAGNTGGLPLAPAKIRGKIAGARKGALIRNSVICGHVG